MSEELKPCPRKDKNQAEMCWQDAVAFATIVPEWSPLFKKFIKGTPLENDIPVWMAEYALRMRDATIRHANRTPDPKLTEALDLAKMVDDMRVAKEALEYSNSLLDAALPEMKRSSKSSVYEILKDAVTENRKALTRLKPYEKLFEKEGER